MPRVLGDVENTLRLNDQISGDVLEFYYRNPTPSERQGFQNMAVKRERNKVTYHYPEARLKYGLAIMTGFREGDLARLVDGKTVAMASDKSSPNYAENWKEEVERSASDLAMLLGAHVFEAPAHIDLHDFSQEHGEPVEGE